MSSSPSPAPVVVVIHPSTAPQVVHIHLHAAASDSAALTATSAAAATATTTATSTVTSSSPRTQETKPYTPPRPAYSPPHGHVLRDNQPAPRMPSPRPAPPAWRRVMTEPALATQGHFDPFGSEGQSEHAWFQVNSHPHRAPSATLSHAPTWFGPEHAPNPAAWRSVRKEKGLDLLLSDPASLRSPGLFPQHESQRAPSQAQSPRAAPTQLQPGSPRAVQMPMPMATRHMHQLHHEQQFAQYQSQARPSSRPRGARRAYVETDTETETHTASASVVTRLIHLTDTETRASSVGPELTSRMLRLSVADTITSVPVSHPENDDTEPEPEPENESQAADELGQQTVADLHDAARQLWEQTGHGVQVHAQVLEDADEQEQEQDPPMAMPVQMVFDHQTQQLYPVHGQHLQAQYPAQAQAQVQNFGHQVQFAAQQPQYPAPIQPPQTLFPAQQAQAQRAQVEQQFAQQLFQYREQQQQQQAQHQAPEYHAPPQQPFLPSLQQPRQTQTCIPTQLTPTSLDEPVLPRTANPFLSPQQQQQRAPVRRAQTHPNPNTVSRPSTWHDAFAERPFSLDYVTWEDTGARAASPSYTSDHSHPAHPSNQSHAASYGSNLPGPSTSRHAMQSPRRGQPPHIYRPPSVAVPPSPNIGAAEPWSWVDNPPQAQAQHMWPPLTVPS